MLRTYLERMKAKVLMTAAMNSQRSTCKRTAGTSAQFPINDMRRGGGVNERSRYENGT